MLAKGLVFFSPIGSGFRQWRIGEWLAWAQTNQIQIFNYLYILKAQLLVFD